MPMDPDITRHTPGLFGSVAALLWIKDTWPRRMGYVLAGVAASHYGAPPVALWMQADVALAGFLIGLFGMAITAKVFETFEAAAPTSLVERILKRIGL